MSSARGRRSRRTGGRAHLLAAGLAALLASSADAGAPPGRAAADWPQWRGPDRTGISAERGWLSGWPEGGQPRVAWRAEVGRGHSAVSVAAGRAYTMGWDGQKDTVFAFEAARGTRLWTHSYPCATIDTHPGPRAAPTVEAGRVYTLGQHGDLFCFDAASGKVLWNVRLPATAVDPEYGYGSSPLVEGNLLVLVAGVSGLAVDKSSGRMVWGDAGRMGPPASAVPYVQDGRRAALVWGWEEKGGRAGQGRLLGVDLRDGRVLWSFPWPEHYRNTIVDPVVGNGHVFITTGYVYKRCARLALGGGAPKEDWAGTSLLSYTGGCVLLGGHLYGVDAESAELRCVDWNTGRVRWAQGGFGKHGSLVAADGKLLVQTSSTGKLVVVEATAAGYRELRSARVFEGPKDTFTAPVLAGGRIFCRAYKGEVVCLDLN